MTFKARFSAYNALEELQPTAVREIVSQFHCDFINNFKEHITLGVWVTKNGFEVEPLYLTEDQLTEIKNNVIKDSIEEALES